MSRRNKSQSTSTPWNGGQEDVVLDELLCRGIPVTLENYLSLACLDKDYRLGPEEILQLPESLQEEAWKRLDSEPDNF